MYSADFCGIAKWMLPKPSTFVLETLLETQQNNEASASGDVKPPLAAAVNHQLQPAAAAEATAAVRAATVQQHVYAAAAAAPPQAAAAVQTVVQTNPDGTISLIQVDPANPIITLPDGTQAQVSYQQTIQDYNYSINCQLGKKIHTRNES